MDSSVFVDLYAGSYGPTVLINVPTEELMRWMLEVFVKLADTPQVQIHLGDYDFVRLNELKSFCLSSGTERKKSLRVLNAGGLTLDWVHDSENWQEIAHMVAGLAPCSHEYLSEEGVDDALVMLAFKEGLTLPESMT